ncbi:BolA/IbaG family iron-sulfur metabolism protein [Klebsiella pneumoniae]
MRRRRMPRSGWIYRTLAEELSTTVHALALHTYTIKEWEGLQDTVFASPHCRGAGSIA